MALAIFNLFKQFLLKANKYMYQTLKSSFVSHEMDVCHYIRQVRSNYWSKNQKRRPIVHSGSTQGRKIKTL